MRELVYYVATSLDGYIASLEGNFDAFPTEGDHMTEILDRFADALPTAAAQHLGINQDLRLFSSVVMGWNTYAAGLPFGVTNSYGHLEQVVFLRTRHSQHDSVGVTDDHPVDVVRQLKQQPGAGIWLCGGGHLAAQLVGVLRAATSSD